MDENRPAGDPAAFDLTPGGILVLSHRAGPAEAAVGARLSITALCNLLQSAAGSHATALGVGREALREQGLAWVLLQWSLEMAAWPAAGVGFLVSKEHLDANGHVNNLAYVGWIVESVSREMLRAAVVCRFDISFRAEAWDGERVRIECGPDPGAAPGSAAFRHRIVTDARELALARTVFSDG